MEIKSNNFKVDKEGNMTCNNGKFLGGKIELFGGTKGNSNFVISKQSDYYESDFCEIVPGSIYADNRTGTSSGFYANGNNANKHGYLYCDEKGGSIVLGGNTASDISLRANEGSKPEIICYGDIYAENYLYTSLAERKKNIEKFEENALKIIKKIDIYKYHFKNEKNTDKKHIGFIIGDKYKYSKEVTSIDNKGVDSYAFTSLCCKAIQEQQKIIEEQGEKIKELEGKINGSNS